MLNISFCTDIPFKKTYVDTGLQSNSVGMNEAYISTCTLNALLPPWLVRNCQLKMA